MDDVTDCERPRQFLDVVRFLQADFLDTDPSMQQEIANQSGRGCSPLPRQERGTRPDDDRTSRCLARGERSSRSLLPTAGVWVRLGHQAGCDSPMPSKAAPSQVRRVRKGSTTARPFANSMWFAIAEKFFRPSERPAAPIPPPGDTSPPSLLPPGAGSWPDARRWPNRPVRRPGRGAGFRRTYCRPATKRS